MEKNAVPASLTASCVLLSNFFRADAAVFELAQLLLVSSET
jgi:hypothetical protein